MSEVTRILSQIESGDPSVAEQLLPLVYEELRKLAAARLAGENPGITLQATALVHEAYLRLTSGDETRHFNGRGHFLAAAAEAMRRILVDAARKRRSLRRGGGRLQLDLQDQDLLALPIDDELLDLDQALHRLQDVDPAAAEVVKLRVFAGMTVEETAAHLELSPRTVKRAWSYARAWLSRELTDND